MASRLKLHEELKEILGDYDVYFQPPESVKLTYPCVIYKLTNADIGYADNMTYRYSRRYQITLITKDPDSDLIDKIPKSLRHCSFANYFVSNNLNHYIYDLYY